LFDVGVTLRIGDGFVSLALALSCLMTLALNEISFLTLYRSQLVWSIT